MDEAHALHSHHTCRCNGSSFDSEASSLVAARYSPAGFMLSIDVGEATFFPDCFMVGVIDAGEGEFQALERLRWSGTSGRRRQQLRYPVRDVPS